MPRRTPHTPQSPQKPQAAGLLARITPMVVVAAVSVGCAGVMVLNYPFPATQEPMREQQTISREEVEGTLASTDSDASVEGLAVIGEFDAISQSSDQNRADNLALAAAELDGTTLQPGEALSVNEILGDTSNDSRYKVAPVFSNGSVSSSRGGGVCQVSTALYIAAIKADLDVVERSAHSMVTDYAPIGLDATLVYGEKDLKIRNSADHAITITANSLGQTVDVKIYGASGDDGITYDATSRIVERTEKLASECFSDPEAVGLEPGEKLTFYTAESYRVKYKDGVMQESKLLSTDTYRVTGDSEVQTQEGSVKANK